MNNDQFEDLKQFIDSRISQSEMNFDGKLAGIDGKLAGLNQEILDLRKDMLDGFAGVGGAIGGIHHELEDTKVEFDKRLTKLEQQAA
jgi:hypothetical protein